MRQQPGSLGVMGFLKFERKRVEKSLICKGILAWLYINLYLLLITCDSAYLKFVSIFLVTRHHLLSTNRMRRTEFHRMNSMITGSAFFTILDRVFGIKGQSFC